MGCLACGRQFHDECEIDDCETCHPPISKIASRLLPSTSSGIGAPIKNEAQLKDRKSTGRKRAAQLYHLFEGADCEWRGLKNCGGGKFPIIGCMQGIQLNIHHGPVKDPVHNEPGNVHRICAHCHNRWHALNNPVYNEAEYKLLLHKPEPATEIELLANEAYWRVK